MGLVDARPYVLGFLAIVAGLAVALGVARVAVLLRFPLPSSGATRRYGYIDGLRGYLALAVMVAHCSGYLRIRLHGEEWHTAQPPAVIGNLGIAGVSLFFMVTGFLFYKKIDKGIKGSAWVELFVKRLFRLYPAALLSISTVVAIVLLRSGLPKSLNASDLLNIVKWISFKSEPDLFGYPNSFMINGAVTWSLWYELIFYFFIIPVISAIHQLSKPWLSLGKLVAIIWAATSILDIAGIKFLYLPLFTMGMLIFEIVNRGFASRLLRSPEAAALACVSVVAGLVITDQLVIQSVLFAPILACAASGNSFSGAISARPSIVLGECSYSIYLFHMIVLNIIFIDLQSFVSTDSYPSILMACVGAVAFVCTLAVVVFLYAERPAMAFGATIADKLAGRATKKRLDLADSVAP